MPKNTPTVEIDAFRGVNNSERPSRLEPGWLTDSKNIDIDDRNGIARRAGYSLISGIGAVTAAFATDDESSLYVVEAGDLKRVESMSPYLATTLATGLSSDEIYWVEVGNQIFYAGGSTGIISGNDVLPFGIPTPSVPALSVVAGSLAPGRYLAALVYRDEYGREGGCRGVSEIELAAEGGIQFIFDEQAGYTPHLYVSEVNGDQLFYLSGATSGFQLTAGGPTASALDFQQMESYPPPDNVELITFQDSRVVVSEVHNSVTYIYRSRPFWYFLFDLSDYIAIPGHVRLLRAIGPVLVIGTDDEIYVWSEDGGLQQVADYGVVPGHAKLVEGKLFFWSKRGLCAALPFTNITDETYSVPHGTRAAVGLNEAKGRKMLVIATDSSGNANNPY